MSRVIAEKILTTSYESDGALYAREELLGGFTFRKLLPQLAEAYLKQEKELGEVRQENARLRKVEEEVLTEKRRQTEWDAFCRESDVRCIDCGMRYAEREDYGCRDQVGLPHRYDEEELAEARELRDES